MNAINRPRSAERQRSPQTDAALAAALEHSARDLIRATCHYIVQLREFDLRRAYRRRLKGGGTADSTPDWLRLTRGVGRARTARHLRVGYALLAVPEVETAFANGELSYRKVRALTRAANAATERPLVDLARTMTDKQVETFCRRVRRRGYTRAGKRTDD